MSYKDTQSKGSAILVILVIIAILIFIKFDFRKALESKQVKEIKAEVMLVWKNYLEKPVSYILNNIFSSNIKGTIDNFNTTGQIDLPLFNPDLLSKSLQMPDLPQIPISSFQTKE